ARRLALREAGARPLPVRPFRQMPRSCAVSMPRSGGLCVRPAARHRRPGPLALAARPDSPRRWTPLSHTPATRTADAPSGAGPAPLLHARDLAKSYEGRPVLDGVSPDVAPRQRLGPVGDNGTGKSTLLGLLAGALDPDAGTVARPGDTGFLHQEPTYPEETGLGAIVEDALAPSRAVERELTVQAEAMNAAPDAAGP